MIFTTSKSLAERGRALHAPDLAAAIVDREYSSEVASSTSTAPRCGPVTSVLDDPTAPEASTQEAKVSGTERPNFPEPTANRMTKRRWRAWRRRQLRAFTRGRK